MTLLTRPCFAEAEEGLLRFARAQGFDIQGFIEGLISGEGLAHRIDPNALLHEIKAAIASNLYALAADLILPIFGCVIVRSVCGHGHLDNMLNLLCALCCASTLTRIWTECHALLSSMISKLIEASEVLAPALITASAVMGGRFWTSAASSFSGICSLFLNRVLLDWGTKLCGMAAMVALCGAIARRHTLSRLFELLRSTARWLLAASIFTYGALVSAQGIAGASLDSATMKAAKNAIESVVPVIGGGVSDAAGSLLSSFSASSGVLGVTGAALLLHMCLAPLMTLGEKALALKLIAALVEPLSDGAVSELMGRFGEVMEIMFAIGVCAVVMAAMIPICFAVVGADL